MDKEQRKRMAWRTVIQHDEGQGDIGYAVEVSGNRVELHQIVETPTDNANGTGHAIESSTWVMSKDVFKQLLKVAQECIEQSEAFEATHPQEKAGNDNADQ